VWVGRPARPAHFLRNFTEFSAPQPPAQSLRMEPSGFTKPSAIAPTLLRLPELASNAQDERC
jgi:hypothetical protein